MLEHGCDAGMFVTLACFDAHVHACQEKSLICVIITCRLLPYNESVIGTDHMDTLCLDF